MPLTEPHKRPKLRGADKTCRSHCRPDEFAGPRLQHASPPSRSPSCSCSSARTRAVASCCRPGSSSRWQARDSRCPSSASSWAATASSSASRSSGANRTSAGVALAFRHAMFRPDAEPSRKERGHRGVRPCHPNRQAFGPAGAGSSSGPEHEEAAWINNSAVSTLLRPPNHAAWPRRVKRSAPLR
jgi:hypothetical protein